MYLAVAVVNLCCNNWQLTTVLNTLFQSKYELRVPRIGIYIYIYIYIHIYICIYIQYIYTREVGGRHDVLRCRRSKRAELNEKQIQRFRLRPRARIETRVLNALRPVCRRLRMRTRTDGQTAVTGSHGRHLMTDAKM